MAHGGSVKAIIYALLANLGVALSKAVAAIITGSGAMLAEAIHSFADCGNQVLLFLGLARSKKAPSPEHPLGYGKAIYFWSFLVALMLFSMGGCFAIYEGIHKISAPQEVEHPWVAIIVLVAAIIMEGLAFRGAFKQVKKIKGDLNLFQWFRKTRQSELFVIIAEDFAALIGLNFAIIAVILSLALDNPLFDAIGSISIGILLVFVAIAVGIEVKSLLIGESADPVIKQQIEEEFARMKAIKRVLNLITIQLGPQVMVAVKAEMDTVDSALELIKQINACEKQLREAVPTVGWLFFEPDIEA